MPLSPEYKTYLDGLKAFQGLIGEEETIFNTIDSMASTISTASLLGGIGFFWRHLMEYEDVIPEQDDGTMAGYLLLVSFFMRVTIGFLKGLYSKRIADLPANWSALMREVHELLAMADQINNSDNPHILSLIRALEAMEKKVDTRSFEESLESLNTTALIAEILVILQALLKYLISSNLPLNEIFTKMLGTDNEAREMGGMVSGALICMLAQTLYPIGQKVETLASFLGGGVKKIAIYLSPWVRAKEAASQQAATDRLANFIDSLRV